MQPLLPMNDTTSRIIAGGGWHKQTLHGRPKARFFTFLSLVWSGVSVTLGGLFYVERSDATTQQLPPTLYYLCAAAVILHVLFITAAIVFRLIEQPRDLSIRLPRYEPRDPHKLF